MSRLSPRRSVAVLFNIKKCNYSSGGCIVMDSFGRRGSGPSEFAFCKAAALRFAAFIFSCLLVDGFL